MPREIITDWTTPSGSDFVTVTFWHTTPAVADQRQAWADFLDTCATSLDDNVSWNIRTVGREMDDVTGALTDAWGDATVQSGGGANSGDVVPDASQILVRWNTSTIINSRFVRGRNFIPGASTAAVDEGNLLAANILAISNGAAALIASANAFGVWHRPVSGAGGDFSVATTASVWQEFAVLRQRRN
jgi:hypothetical protein